MAQLSAHEVAAWRMRNLRLDGAPLPTAQDLVACLGAVQAQDYGPAKWSLGQRSTGLTDADVERAYAEGEILRTHVLRPTWHFVAPSDIRWLLELTRPRVHALTAFGRRRDELDLQTFRRAHSVFVDALQGRHQLTRNELGARLREQGIEATGTRLAHILMQAELEGLMCSGVLRGKQHTYALLDERVPPAPQLTRDEALVQLTCRYFSSHGPASAKDFQWWSSLSLAEVRRGLELASSELQTETIDGVAFWFGDLAAESCVPRRRVHLLQMFDEYLVGYSQTRGALDRAGITSSLFSTINVRSGALIVDTQLAGTWRRSIGKDGLLIAARLAEALGPSHAEALEAEAQRHADFLGQRLSLRVET
jgi:Winged helix DNA-binding domain